MISTVERNRASARWKITSREWTSHLPRCEPQQLRNTRRINSVKSIANSTRSLQHWGQPPEVTPSILTWINADCDRVVAAVTLSNCF